MQLLNRRLAALALAAVLDPFQAGAQAPAPAPPAAPKAPAAEEAPRLDVPYVPTPQAVVDEMLKLAKPTRSDLLYDLGCLLADTGETERALAVFLELQADAPGHRDVSDRVERLTQGA